METGAARARAGSSQFQVNQEGRKPLFTKTQDEKPRPEVARYKPPGASQSLRRNNSTSKSAPHGSANTASPAGTRLPKLSPTTTRKNLTLFEALELAEKEEQDESQVMDASPSPAPRIWRARRDGDDDKMREKGLREDHLDTKSRSRKPDKASTSGSRVAETGRELAKVTGNEGSWLENRELRTRSKQDQPWLKELGGTDSAIPDLVPGIEDLPVPSVEENKGVPPWRRSTASKPSTSPEKSYAWQIDEDFTAGDLQVSDSPRIKTESQPFANRLKFDENTEVDINSKTRVNTPGSLNTKIDDIHRRETKVGSNIPVQRPGTKSQDQAANVERPRTANNKIDDIKQAEEKGLTPRQLSQAKLAEIQEQNAASRSKSPEEQSVSSQNSQEHKRTPRDKPTWRPTGERPREGPPPTYPTREERIAQVRASSPKSSVDLGHKRADSRELLRQLSRTTSTNASPDTQPRKSVLSNRNSSSSSDRRSPRRAQTATNLASRKKNGKGATKPTVNFNLRRVKSSESSSGSKRSSLHSEDPTPRIDAELNLFAPRDDYSEKGSVRASSPTSDYKKESEAEVEATPKAKVDHRTMPTPKVTGAYVETPVTVKSHRFESDLERNNDLIASMRSKRASRRRDTDTNSEPGEDEKLSSASAPKTRRPRSSSLPRRRPIKNSALPASVKADLEALKQSFNYEDSTADATFEGIMMGTVSPQQKASLDEIPGQPFEEDSFDQTLKEYSEQPARNPESLDQEDMDAHNGRIEKDLRDNHTLQQKVERLQNDPRLSTDSKPEIKKETPPPPVHVPEYAPAPAPAPSSAVAYIMLPVPRLWTSRPKLRFTFFGLLLFLLGLWYTLEAGMCKLYCQPATCTTTPCVWSYDDPTFGKALPVKLDHWMTGGMGRNLVNTAAENAEDWLADVLDAAYGREITDIDVDSLTFEGRRAHRRRLRKKGLLKRHDDADPGARAKWDAWHRERVAQQHARDLREMGYHSVRGEDEPIGGDERIW